MRFSDDRKNRRSFIAGIAGLTATTIAPALAQATLPFVTRAIGATGWTLAADKARVELRANAQLTSNAAFVVGGAPAGGVVGAGAPFAFRIGRIFRGVDQSKRTLAGFIGTSFTSNPVIPQQPPGETIVAVLAVEAGGQTFPSISGADNATLDGVVGLFFDTDKALDSLVRSTSCTIKFAVMRASDRSEVFHLSFDIDTSQVTDAAVAYLSEIEKREAHLAAGGAFEDQLLR